jgi:hypothetical protein
VGCSEPSRLPTVIAHARWGLWSMTVVERDTFTIVGRDTVRETVRDTLWQVTARTYDGDLTVQLDNRCADSIRIMWWKPVYCIEAWRFDAHSPDGKEWDGPPEDIQDVIWRWAKARR